MKKWLVGRSGTHQMIDINAIKASAPLSSNALVDRVWISERWDCCSEKCDSQWPFFNGHFPPTPGYARCLIMEALAQTAGVLELSKEENKGKLVFYAGMDRLSSSKLYQVINWLWQLSLSAPRNDRGCKLTCSQYFDCDWPVDKGFHHVS